jgi:hypothetical protein
MNEIKLLTIVLLLLTATCKTRTDNTPHAIKESSDTAVALKFINDYVDFYNKNGLPTKSGIWVNNNELATEQFKITYKEIIEHAIKDDPETGLGFDPIFDAQDYPEKGFEFLSSDNDGYVTLKGIDWPDFTTVVKIKLVGSKWMVDGAGVVNVPDGKKAKR